MSENANSLWVSHLTDDELTSLRGLEPDVAVNARWAPGCGFGDGQTSRRAARFWQSIRWVAASRWVPATQGQQRRIAAGRRWRDVLRRCDSRTHTRGLLRQRAIAAGTGALKPPGAVAPRSNGATNCCGSPNLRICRSRCCGCLTRYCASGLGQRAAESRGRGHVGLPRTPHHGSVRTPCSTTHDLDPAQPRRPRRRQRQRGGWGRRGLGCCSALRGGTCSECSSWMTATAAAVGYLSK